MGVAEDQDGWRLRLATLDDIDGLHSLASIPLVYRYLFDGGAPEREFIAGWIAQSLTSAADTGVGMWLLGNSSARYAGCVELRPDLSARSAELTYMLDPEYWGQGLAVRMSWTAITQAFLSPQIDSVIAGADLPNTASFAVMKRLGMQFRRNVTYPLTSRPHRLPLFQNVAMPPTTNQAHISLTAGSPPTHAFPPLLVLPNQPNPFASCLK